MTLSDGDAGAGVDKYDGNVPRSTAEPLVYGFLILYIVVLTIVKKFIYMFV